MRAVTALLFAALVVAPSLASAQSRGRSSRSEAVPTAPSDAREWVRDCEDDGWNEQEVFCEVRDTELPASTRRLNVDARRNGGVSVRGWDRNTVLVRAKIRTQARSESAARRLASELRIRTEPGSIGADGATRESRESWSVSYEIWVPRASDYDITAESYNGGISVSGLGGVIRAETHNGGISLRDVQGDVRARATNGGVNVSLSGERWQGAGLDVVTRNGGVRLDLPSGYNAQLETGTTNGSMNVDFPVTVQGRLGRTLSAQLGSGGAPVRVLTTNGSVRVSRR